MPVVGAFIFPHPPLIVPEVGQGRHWKICRTMEACEEAARRVAVLKPDTIVLVSPHSVMYADYFHISPGASARGDLSHFGAPQLQYEVNYDASLALTLASLAEQAGLRAGMQGEQDAALDHGTMIPLHFVNQHYTEYKLIRIGLSGLSAVEHYKLGQCIAKAAEQHRVIVLASGDLSHKLSEDGPYGFAPEGPAFDRQVTDAIREGDFLRFLSFSPSLTEKAAECGLRSFIIMAGALDQTAVQSELLSYEGPFGVGYAVASFLPTGPDDRRAFLASYQKTENLRLQELKEREDEYVRLARHSLEHFVKTGQNADVPVDLSRELTGNRSGVFVSLKKHGQLRGCIGTISPVTGSIAQEILRNAVCAASEDPRFDPVTPDELAELVYSVDVLSPPEPITSTESLDVTRYGVIVTSGTKRGLLLPNLDGVDTVEQQIDIARRKAGIGPKEQLELQRFEVVRHT